MVAVLRIAVFLGCVYAAIAACSFTPIPNAATKDGYCASIWASGLTEPRGIIIADNGDALVVESGAGVAVLWEENGAVQQVQLINNGDLNHGIALNGAYLYASSESTIYRWPYKSGMRSPITSSPEVIVIGIPTGGHSSRTLQFDAQNVLYVSIGSGSNMDASPVRAGVMMFDLTNIPTGGILWENREVFALGLRNECGIRFDSKGLLWGVENGIDNLDRPDLGGDIHNLNPGEEVNMISSGNFYGYPYCWSQFDVPAVTTPEGTQYVHPNFMGVEPYSDAWCQNASNVIEPKYQMQPHTAPLDILFYDAASFPGINVGDAFVSQHGSWDRQPPAGYRVIHLTFKNMEPVADEPMLFYAGPGQTGPGWHRPVGLAMATCQGVDCLLITSDATGSILALTPTPNCTCSA